MVESLDPINPQEWTAHLRMECAHGEHHLKLPTSASEALRRLHPHTSTEALYLHILRLDPNKQRSAQTKTLAFSELDSAFDDEVALCNADWNQFITVSAFSDPTASRTSEHASVIDTLFIDVDVATLRKTHLPATTDRALAFLLNELPIKPTFVNSSGRGLHALYSLDTPIYLADDASRTHAAALLSSFQQAVNRVAREKHGWKFDGVADLARVHRIPFSRNLKDASAGDCHPIWVGDSVTLQSVEDFVASAPATVAPMASKSSTALDAMRRAETKWLSERKNNTGSANAASVYAGCSFMRHALNDAATLSEPEWHAAINLLSRCEDGRTLTHAFSQGHPEYDGRQTDTKFDEASADQPVGCGYIVDRLDHDACQDCPFAGRITTPAELGTRSSALTELLANTVYVASIGAFVDLRNPDCDPLSPEKFKRFHAGPTLSGSADDLFLKDRLATKAHQRVWRPDVSRTLFSEGSQTLLNTYRAPQHGVEHTDPKRFFEHMDYLIPNADERAVVLDYLAHLVQRPASKLTYGITLVSPQGAGKTYIHEVMSRVLGKDNARVVNGRSLDDRFRRHMAGRVLLVMEEVSMEDRSRTYEGLKALISNETDEFEAKYLPMETMQTPRGVMLFTNHSHALYLAKDDRRFFVVQCSGPHPNGPAYYKPLFDDVGSPAFIAGVWAALKARDISAFNAKHPPFVTAAKRQMIENSRSELDVLIEELFESGEAPFDRDLATWDELRDAVRGHRHADASLSDRRIKKALSERGYVIDPQDRQCAVDGRRLKLYMRDPMQFASLSAAQLSSELAGLRPARSRAVYIDGNVLAIAANN